MTNKRHGESDILIIDHESNIIGSLNRQFRCDGYTIYSPNSEKIVFD